MMIERVHLGAKYGGQIAVCARVSNREGRFHYWVDKDTFEPTDIVIHRNREGEKNITGQAMSKHSACKIDSKFGKEFVSVCRKAIDSDGRAMVKRWEQAQKDAEDAKLAAAAAQARITRMELSAELMYKLIEKLNWAEARLIINYVENDIREFDVEL